MTTASARNAAVAATAHTAGNASAQRKGVGTALLQHVFDVARARRFTGVQAGYAANGIPTLVARLDAIATRGLDFKLT